MLEIAIALLLGGLIAGALHSKENTFEPKFDYENEITGSYYPTSFFDGFDWKVAIAVVGMIVVCGAILLQLVY